MQTRFPYQDWWPAGAKKPLLGFAAFSGTGKTTLLRQLIPLLNARGVRVGLIKHAHHAFDVDIPGKDSYELRKAGAEQVLVASRRRWALIVEQSPEVEPTLGEVIGRLEQDALDLVLVEGFKRARFPKIELLRTELGAEPLHETDPYVIAVATDRPQSLHVTLPILDLNAPETIADHIVSHVLTPNGVNQSRKSSP